MNMYGDAFDAKLRPMIGGLGGESFSSPNREMLCKRRDASKKGIAGKRPVGSD